MKRVVRLGILGALATVAIVAQACSADEELSPKPAPTTTPTNDGGPMGDASPPPSDGGPKKRTIETRDPFGNVAVTKNLLWDGDFEWESPFSDEYGWLEGLPFSYNLPTIALGAACRSGVKCAVLNKGRWLAAVGVGSRTDPLEASVWVNVPSDDCKKVSVSVRDLLDTGTTMITIPAVHMTANAEHWCSYLGTTPVLTRKPLLVLVNSTKDKIIIDDAVLVSYKAGSPPKPPPAPYDKTLEDDAVNESLRAAMKQHEGPHDSPPNAARRAFEAFAR